MAPRVALAPGPEIGGLADAVDTDARLSSAELGAAGTELVLGRLDGVPVALVLGDPAPPVTAIRLARLLGADVLLVARVAHSLTPEAEADALGAVADHIGLLVPNPLIGPNVDELGPRFPDMSEPYDPALRTVARDEAQRAGFALGGGVYAGHPRPNLATPAEYRMLRRLGADWVGRGGVPEVIVARHAGMRVLALVGLPDSERRLAALARGVVARLA